MDKTTYTIMGQCNKCGAEEEIQKGHLGKRHKCCNDRKQDGSSRQNCGVWIVKPKKEPKEEGKDNA